MGVPELSGSRFPGQIFCDCRTNPLRANPDRPGLGCSFSQWVLGLGADAQETTAVRGEGLGYLTMGEDFVWFAQASSDGGYVQYPWRVSTGELSTVGQGLVSGEAVVGGGFFSWATFHGRTGTRTLAELAD